MIGQFVIEGRLPGLNEIIAQTNHNRYAGASLKKKETRRCQFAIMAGRVPVFSVPVAVAFRWIEPNFRRDPDNITAGAKFILDALSEMKRIPNDTRRWIKAIEHEFPDADADKPRVEVTIRAA